MKKAVIHLTINHLNHVKLLICDVLQYDKYLALEGYIKQSIQNLISVVKSK